MDELRLIERLKTSGFEASVITSFNAYLPFYEAVVLPRLTSSGSRLNSVLMDGNQMSLALSSPELRPRSAGHAYTLAPVRGSRAFHPKILIAGGPRKGLVAVGSHNLTLAGYGHNREVTTVVDVQGKADTEAVAFARAAWAFIVGWTEAQREHLPEPVVSGILKTADLIPWLKGKPSQRGPIEFFGALPDGPCLWDQLLPRLTGGVSRATLVGPFFDKKLSFLGRVLEDLDTTDLTVAIDPKTVDYPIEATRPSGVRVVDASALSGASGYLHGKIAFFEMTSGDAVLVLGSANPSFPAWLGRPGERNAEAVVAHTGPLARELAEKMGIDGLTALPDLSGESWEAIASREGRDEPGVSSISRSRFALESEEGFEIRDASLTETEVRSVHLVHEGSSDTSEADHQQSGGVLSVVCPRESRKTVRFLSVGTGSGSFFALVHHAQEIQARGQTSRQAQLRSALSSLGGDQPDLTKLIQVVERIVFDDAETSSITVLRSARAKEGKEPDEGAPIGTLAGSVEESKAKRRSRRKRLAEGGDIGAVLDLLMHHLGIGLPGTPEGVDRKGRSEEERKGSDDADDDPPILEPKLVEGCHRKVKGLIGRMLKQLKAAGDDESRRLPVVAQLAAVLALLREIRTAEHRAEWVPPGQTLVPREERRRLFEGAVSYLYSDSHSLLGKILESLDGDRDYEELSRVGGLLLWLAWDGGLRGTEIPSISADRDDRRQKLLERARLLILCHDVVDDDVAVEEAKNSLARVSLSLERLPSAQWLDWGLRQGAGVIRAMQEPDASAGSADIEVGDLVATTVSNRPRLVMNRDPGFVWLADLAPDAKDRKFKATAVRRVAAALE